MLIFSFFIYLLFFITLLMIFLSPASSFIMHQCYYLKGRNCCRRTFRAIKDLKVNKVRKSLFWRFDHLTDKNYTEER